MIGDNHRDGGLQGTSGVTQAPAAQGAPQPSWGPPVFKGAPIQPKANEYLSDMGDKGAPHHILQGGHHFALRRCDPPGTRDIEQAPWKTKREERKQS